MSRTSPFNGNVNRNALLKLTVVASSTYQTALDTTTVNGTAPENAIGELVTFTYSNNYEVARTADNAIPNAVVESCQRQTDGTYVLTVAVLNALPSGTSATYKKPTAVVQLPYRSGATVTLGKPVICDATGSVYVNADDSGTNADGLGVIVSKDTTNLTVDILV